MDLVLAGLSITAYMVWSPLPWAFTLLLIPTYVVIVAWVARAMTGVVYIEHHWRMALYTSAVCNVIALTLALA